MFPAFTQLSLFALVFDETDDGIGEKADLAGVERLEYLIGVQRPCSPSVAIRRLSQASTSSDFQARELGPNESGRGNGSEVEPIHR